MSQHLISWKECVPGKSAFPGQEMGTGNSKLVDTEPVKKSVYVLPMRRTEVLKNASLLAFYLT